MAYDCEEIEFENPTRVVLFEMRAQSETQDNNENCVRVVAEDRHDCFWVWRCEIWTRTPGGVWMLGDLCDGPDDLFEAIRFATNCLDYN